MVGIVQHVFSNTVANATGTITIWNISGNSTTIAATNVVRPQDWNSTHNIFLTISGNTNTAGASTLSGTNIYLQGGPGIYLSGTSNSVIINAVTQSASQPNNLAAAAFASLGQNTVYVQPFYLGNVNLSMTAMVLPLSINQTTNTTVGSQRAGWTMNYGIYSQTGNTLSLMTSSSLAIQVSYSSNSTYGYTVSGTGAAASYTTSSNGTGLTAAFAEPMFFYLPFATSLQPGFTYFGAFNNSTSTAGSNQMLAVSVMQLTGFSVNAWGTGGTNSIPSVTSSTVTDRFLGGLFSATSGGLAASLNNTAFSNLASNAAIYFEMAAT